MTDPECLAPSIEDVLAEEQAKFRKLEIIFGSWWRHYAVPYEFRWTLYRERICCPYCGEQLGTISTNEESSVSLEACAHLDHMDPLSRGGEDSIRNVVYACAKCNLSKRNRLFVDWLEMIEPSRREQVRLIYQEKHEHPPEFFVPGRRQTRLTRPRVELKFGEAVLRKLFPRPIVTGPPARE